MACLARMFQRFLKKETIIVVANPLTNQGLGKPSPQEMDFFFRHFDAREKAFVANLKFTGKSYIDEGLKNELENQGITRLDQNKRLVKYNDFVHLRTLLFISNSLKEAKVAQLSDYIYENSASRLLQKNGDFRTRNLGGKDYASSYYLSICLSSIPRLIFPKAEDILLDNLKEDGQSIEPSRYMPITPMVLAKDSRVIVEAEAPEENSESIGTVHEKVQTLCGEVDKFNNEVDFVVLAKEMKLDKSDSQVEEARKKSIGQHKNAPESGWISLMEKKSENRCSRELDGALSKDVLGHARTVQHHVELPEKYFDLVAKRRAIMEWTTEHVETGLSAIRVKRVKRSELLKKKNKSFKLEPRQSASFPERDKVDATKALCVEGANLNNKVKELRKKVTLIT